MIQDLYKKFTLSTGISTDTRKIKSGNLFFALKGPNFNANEFADEALSSGASYAVIDNKKYIRSDRTILVKDALKALQDLAVFHRKQLRIPVLAITGSNGKTTTKELVKVVLDEKYVCHTTEGNLNNHIGVPLTILKIKKDTEIAIIEMGANKLGDITELCSIAEPTHGIITNIGKAHTEGFGSFEGVLRGKSELYHWLIHHQGIVFINSLDKTLFNMSKRFKKPVFYPQVKDYYRCELIEVNPWIRIKSENEKIIQTQLVGAYNFPNLAAALCIAKYFDVDPDKANKAVSTYHPSNNRSQVIVRGTNTVILDAYNANPESMKAALDNLSNIKVSKKVVILGDMFELGVLTQSEHRAIGKMTSQEGFEEVIFCGEHMKYAKQENNNSVYFKSRSELEKYIENRNFKNCVILIKGSRGMAMEVIAQYI
jgi:UDP-N-acetylmuramoyl-tripeptide--D-alanyl-D-alanine ligase